MPWRYNITQSSSQPSPNNYSWYGLNYKNQECSAIYVNPGEAITHVTVYAAGRGGSVLTRNALWWLSSPQDVMGQSNTYSMAQGAESIGGQAWHSAALITPVLVSGGGGYIAAGLYRNPSGAHISGTNTANDTYQKTNTNGFPAISNMNGYVMDTDEALLVGIFYITSPDNITTHTASRNSDTSITLNWTNHSSSDKPYDGIVINRWDNVINAWYSLITVGGASTSYTDHSCIANRRYIYRVRPYNIAGQSSTHAYSNDVKNTPAAPTNVVATRNGSNIDIVWTNNATNADYMKIQKNEWSGGAWQGWVNLDTAMSGTATTKTDTSPYVSGKYRVWAYVDTPLNSSYVESNTVAILAAPSKPTNLEPNSLEVVVTAESYLFSWQHNSTDSSGQTKYSLQYRIIGAGSWTNYANEVSNTNEYVTIPADEFTTDNNYEWQVKTWGSYVTGSDWSNSATFKANSRPTVVVTTPSSYETLTTSDLVVNWNFNDVDGDTQIQAHVSLYYYPSLELVDAKDVYGTSNTCTFEDVLEDGMDYKVVVWVIDSSSLVSYGGTCYFDTAFYTPPRPEITCTFDSDYGHTIISIVNPSPEGDEVEASYNQLYRSIDGVNYVLLYYNIPLNTVVTDYLPLINGDTYYFVKTVSATPTTKNSYITTMTNSLVGGFFINGNNDYSTVVKILGDVIYTEGFERQAVLKKFEGRTYKVKFSGEELKQNINFSGDLPHNDYNNMLSILSSIQPMFYRDWKNRYFKVHLSDTKFIKKDNMAYTFTCKIDRLEDL